MIRILLLSEFHKHRAVLRLNTDWSFVKKDLYLVNTQKLINLQVLADCPLQSQRVRNDYQKVVRSGQQCAQILPLSTRLAARPIWDKTKNKYIRGCDAKMVEAL